MSYTISERREPLRPRETIAPSDYLIPEWNADWSGWYKVMNRTKINADWERRDGRGYRLKPKLVSTIFRSKRRLCGIYEILAMKDETEVFVVYVGSSCRSKCQSLPQRIKEYCANGSHKADLIDDALMKGYTLYFRYKLAGSPEEAQDDENKLLVKYSYAWNVRTITGTLPD